VSRVFTFFQFKMSNVTPVTLKVTTLYVAYAPDFDVAAYGGCQDEALNNLTDELRQRDAVGESTGDETNSYVQS
jgi:hypothetical protein